MLQRVRFVSHKVRSSQLSDMFCDRNMIPVEGKMGNLYTVAKCEDK